MKQKKCPQCKNLISITAPTCLFCGRPNKFVTNNYVKRKWNKEYKKEKLNKYKMLISTKKLIIIIIIIILIMLLISLY
tara:strand:+ start:163 stop:396 length:234 start_codon:yes stop_codon:yes gene_type:complete